MSLRTTVGTGVMCSSNVARLSSMGFSSWHLTRCILSVNKLVYAFMDELLKRFTGYAGYYGLSLIVGSYPLLFVSLAAHAAQFGFLVFFENPR